MATQVSAQSVQVTVSTGQGPAGAPPRVSITDIVYDGSDRVVEYSMNGVAHVVTYVTDGGGITTATDVGGGTTRTTVTDALGRITSAQIS